MKLMPQRWPRTAGLPGVGVRRRDVRELEPGAVTELTREPLGEGGVVANGVAAPSAREHQRQHLAVNLIVVWLELTEPQRVHTCALRIAVPHGHARQGAQRITRHRAQTIA